MKPMPTCYLLIRDQDWKCVCSRQEVRCFPKTNSVLRMFLFSITLLIQRTDIKIIQSFTQILFTFGVGLTKENDLFNIQKSKLHPLNLVNPRRGDVRQFPLSVVSVTHNSKILNGKFPCLAYPCCIYYPPVSHLVILLIRSTVCGIAVLVFR